jgi:peroxidase
VTKNSPSRAARRRRSPRALLAFCALAILLPASLPAADAESLAGPPGAAAGPPPGTAPTAQWPELRSYTGAGNNRSQPAWGQAGTPFRRLTTVGYGDGLDTPAGAGRPSARQVSNRIAASTGSRPNSRNLSDYIWQWGQFLDHDLDLTLSAAPAEPFPVPVPLGDLYFDPNSTGVMTIPLNRSSYQRIGNVRQQRNNITAYIDASMVYGSDAATAASLRANDGTGKLKTSAGNLLPLSAGGFLAGDIRVNEQTNLIAIQTLFLREHNFWAGEIRAANPGWSDEQIYQLARAIVGAEIQQITYREFLPLLLGPNALAPYRGYRPNVDAGIENSFATAAYRLGHSMLSSSLLRLDRFGRPVAQGPLRLKDAFFNTAAVSSLGIEPYLRGMARQKAQELDNQIVDDVRNFLFGVPGAGGFDLASLNIQRGRDHGLPSYNQARANYGLPRLTGWHQVSGDPNVRAKLASLYASPDQADLWVAGLAEDHLPGAMVGPTFHAILKDQFERLRDGDRFWHEGYLPPSVLQNVRDQNLSRILRRNTGIGGEIQNNVWIVP